MSQPIDRAPESGGRGAKSIRLAVGIVVIVAAVVLLVVRANQSHMVYYVTVSELLGRPAQADQKGLRLAGKVVAGSVDRQDLQLRFAVTDGEKSLPVIYRGVVPDTFGEDGEVVVEGRYGGDGVFEASFLMAKCPSKYESAPGEPAQHPDEIPKEGSKGI